MAPANSFQNPYQNPLMNTFDTEIQKSPSINREMLRAIKQHMEQVKASPSITDRSYRTEILRLRMRWKSDEGPFQRLYHEFLKTKNVVALIVIKNEDVVVLEDGADLFPSDTLLTQLRLLTD